MKMSKENYEFDCPHADHRFNLHFRERERERVSGHISCGAPFPFKIRAGLAWPTVTIIQKRGYECRPRSNRDAGRMEKLLPPPITHDNAAMVITTGWGGEGWTG